MKLNLGCGRQKIAGYVNVDKYGDPDVRHDLEQFPWPWPDDSFDEVLASHVLEHLGRDPDDFIGVMKELYRVCRGGAQITIAVPHPRHESFISDPTHVRAITPLLISLFSRRNNLHWQAVDASNSPLALYHGVDFEVRSIRYTLEERYLKELQSGRFSNEDIDRLILERNNVASAITMVVEVIKA